MKHIINSVLFSLFVASSCFAGENDCALALVDTSLASVGLVVACSPSPVTPAACPLAIANKVKSIVEVADKCAAPQKAKK
jgi:hypothetical protein